MARGSVFKRSGGWAIRVDAGFHPETGRRRQMLRQGFATRKEAQEALADLIGASARGMAVSRTTISVEAYLREWLVTSESHHRATTHHSYAICVDRIVRHLGGYQLQSLTPLQIERFYVDLLARGGRGGKPLSEKTVRNTHVVLRKALADGERLGVVPRNAAAAARPPAQRKSERTAWSSDDLRCFLDAVRGHEFEMAFHLLAATGMRRGEVLGLQWRDVDFDLGQLAIAHTISTVGNDTVTGPPKTARGRRNVYLDQRTLAMLRQHRQTQREQRLVAGPAWDSSKDLVTCDVLGGPVHPNYFSREFKRLLVAADIAPIRLHDLRHTHATLALKAGVHPKVVSERLGHATVGITLDLYSHVVPSLAREAAELIMSGTYGT